MNKLQQLFYINVNRLDPTTIYKNLDMEDLAASFYP